MWCPKEYELCTQLNSNKEYQLVFNNCVVRPGTTMTYRYGYQIMDVDHFNDDARGLFPDAGDDDDNKEEVMLDAADIANIDTLLDLSD